MRGKWRNIMQQLIGGIEAGGTKMVCAIGRADGTLVKRGVYPTRSAGETVEDLCAFFKGSGIAALGIGTFGPVCLNRESPRYGCLLATPKVRWRGFDFAGTMQRALDVPVVIDTDVNAACLGELVFGSCQGLDSCVYITVGTGIGVGVCIGGKPLHGMLHPEAGHLTVRHAPGDDFAGACPVHGDCFEGLASGPAICERFGVGEASDLADDQRFLQLESSYLAQGIASCILAYAPERIVLGGGVPDHIPRLLPLVRTQVTRELRGYLDTPELRDLDSYLVAPGCAGDQGILGAIALASRA